jgi:hypothetical protein
MILLNKNMLKGGLSKVIEMMKGGPGSGRKKGSVTTKEVASQHGYSYNHSADTPMGQVTHYADSKGNVISAYPKYGGEGGGYQAQHYNENKPQKKTVHYSPAALKAHLDKFHGVKKSDDEIEKGGPGSGRHSEGGEASKPVNPGTFGGKPDKGIPKTVDQGHAKMLGKLGFKYNGKDFNNQHTFTHPSGAVAYHNASAKMTTVEGPRDRNTKQESFAYSVGRHSNLDQAAKVIRGKLANKGMKS